MGRHERFAAWQRCHELVLAVYQATGSWPKNELFGIVAQMRRAAVSAPANLAEGAAKRGSREFCRYLDFANGSLAELEYLLRLASDLGYVKGEQGRALGLKLEEAAKSVWGLYAAVRKRTTRT